MIVVRRTNTRSKLNERAIYCNYIFIYSCYMRICYNIIIYRLQTKLPRHAKPYYINRVEYLSDSEYKTADKSILCFDCITAYDNYLNTNSSDPAE